jgi:diaminopimelate epimerase
MAAWDQLSALAGVFFTKMTGTGNDFILFDNRQAQIPAALRPPLAKALCCRRRSVGADGLIILNPSDRVDPEKGPVDFYWDFFNADGSSAEMCGNGGRCAARFAFDQGLAGQKMLFDTLAGPIRAWVGQEEDGCLVKLEMVPPKGPYEDLLLEVERKSYTLDGVNTGVPHAVLLSDDLENAPVGELGRAIRFHPHFAPAGTNVNFAAVKDNEVYVRTYERGVEDETLACGTGATAAALVAGRRAGLAPPVSVKVRSGETLKVYFNPFKEDFGEVFLEGAASYVYSATLHAEAFKWLS